jgi:DNA-directed RNA polymerase subunit beta'
MKNWIYVQRITPAKKNSFVLIIRPVLIYEGGGVKSKRKIDPLAR